MVLPGMSPFYRLRATGGSRKMATLSAISVAQPQLGFYHFCFTKGSILYLKFFTRNMHYVGNFKTNEIVLVLVLLIWSS